MADILSIIKIFLIVLGVLVVLVVTIYWFELDMLLIRKLEPTFRKFTGIHKGDNS